MPFQQYEKKVSFWLSTKLHQLKKESRKFYEAGIIFPFLLSLFSLDYTVNLKKYYKSELEEKFKITDPRNYILGSSL